MTRRLSPAAQFSRRTRPAALLAACVAVAGCATASEPPGSAVSAPAIAAATTSPPEAQPGQATSAAVPVAVGEPTVIANGLSAPWGLAFLPDGNALVTERDTARLLRVTPSGEVTEIATVPGVDAGGEGGLLGLAVSPSYAEDGQVFAYYTASDDNRIVTFQLANGGITDPTPVVTGIPISGIHNGGRLGFGPDGMLYAGTGDAAESRRSQDLDSLGGKVLRMDSAGQPPADNPFPGSLVWSLGHRNVQGFDWDEQGRMYATEFGQNTYDEVNLIEPGGNYGWPQVEGADDGQEDYVDPLLTWTTDEASPSGAAYADGAFFAAALRGERLWQVDLDGEGGVTAARSLLTGDYGRLRSVQREPGGGALWVLTSNRDGRGSPVEQDDRILRLPLS